MFIRNMRQLGYEASAYMIVWTTGLNQMHGLVNITLGITSGDEVSIFTNQDFFWTL